ncbi:MAG: PAS domain S-box protein [Nitrospirae bacterium]|nr:PAS domain S-box protein [Nitrospirota bacterium]
MTILPDRSERSSVSRENPQLYAEQVRLLYKIAPVGLIASLINSAVLALILRNVAPHNALLAWFTCIVLITTARFAQLGKFRRASAEPSDYRKWGLRFVAGAAASGAAWGCAVVFLFPETSFPHQAFLAFVLGGMAIGAAGAYSVVMEAFIAYAALSLTPLIVRFLSFGDDIHLAMGGMSLLFLVLITGIAYRISRVTVASLRLRFENSSLVTYLSSAKDDLEKLNKELSCEIAERKKAEGELMLQREGLEELVKDRTAELTAANAGLRQEIMEREKVEEDSKEAEKRYRLLAEVAFDGIAVSEKGVFLETNEAFAKIFGYSPSEMTGLDVSVLIAPEYREDAMKKIASGYDRPYESVCVKKDGKQFPVEVYGKTFSSRDRVLRITAIRDITMKRDLEDELRRRHKLESVGILAGGIAHDFNNLLTAMTNNIYLAMKHIEIDGAAHEFLEATRKAIRSAAGLTRQLLTFAEGGAPVRKPTNIAGLVRGAADDTLRDSHVKCIYNIEEPLWPVEADEGQICQVIRNIVINARQAMPEGGIIQVSAENTIMSSGTGESSRDTRYVKVSVRDEGTGIPRENLQKIFDPYFTTRGTGHGLGLSVAYSIIKSHEGHISVESEPEKGSTFTIYLPASEKHFDPDYS